MCRNILLSVAFWGCIFIALSVTGQNQVTLEDLWIKYEYLPAGIDEFQPLKDGEHYAEVRENRLEKFSFKTGKSAGFLTPQMPFEIQSYQLDGQEENILFTSDSRPIYRHSRQVKAWILPKGKNQPLALAESHWVMEPGLNALGTWCAFVKDHNLFIQNTQSLEIKQITRDGKPQEILNGIPDWVYEEEFSMSRAYAWSPSGEMLAYLRFDESAVPSYSMPVYKGQLYPQNQIFKYPKVGEANSRVTLNVYHVGLNKTQGVLLPDPYEYLPRITWLPDGRLMVATLNRLQNHLRIYVADPHTGRATQVAEMRSPRYVELEKIWHPIFISKDAFLLLSEQSGFFHIWSYSLNANTPRQITSGNWEVTKVYGYDEKSGYLYYQSTQEGPTERHIYKIRLNGRDGQKLTHEPGTHDADFSAGFQYFMKSYSALGVPPVYSCHDNTGRMLYMKEDNAVLRTKLQNLDGSGPELFSFTTSEGVNLNGWMIKPVNFSPSKKYPVLMFVYGGPGSQTAGNDFDGFNYIWFRLLAQKGYLVVSVDGRGTGGRGYEFRTCTYGRLGDLESTDQAEAARWLARQSYVDPGRIGIFGWSYGGYLASLCITRWADVFKAAVAVAPVTNWKFYDNIYTERYMGTLETNPEGFDKESPIRYAKNLKGAFLLIHGTADDNVHFQNAAELASALVAEGKQFDMFVYPDKNHGIYGGLTRYHLFTKITQFILNNL
ncbi:MAG: S9 family peptidase [Flavobacteriales bacterium]|nr:S9 family peptidase [Flavobacteriales bacterium]MCX7649204.1 S9 family peptidase [Flavobacteriales bacterium]MDW8431436.1 S9 family peptidase [Flavobacteriales bacterium]